MPAAVVDGAALGVTVVGLLAAAVVLAAERRPLTALQVLLDFLLAAGLLRLTGRPGWPALATAAAVVAVRRLVGSGLRAGAPVRRAGARRRRRGGPRAARRA